MAALVIVPTAISLTLATSMALYMIIVGGKYTSAPCLAEPGIADSCVAIGSAMLAATLLEVVKLRAGLSGKLVLVNRLGKLGKLLGTANFGLLLWGTIITFRSGKWDAFKNTPADIFSLAVCDADLYERAGAGYITLWLLSLIVGVVACCGAGCVACIMMRRAKADPAATAAAASRLEAAMAAAMASAATAAAAAEAGKARKENKTASASAASEEPAAATDARAPEAAAESAAAASAAAVEVEVTKA